MIKAEIISHEGNAAPNWLDRCRNFVTPGSISLVIVAIAIAALTIGIYRNNDQSSRASSPGTSQLAPDAQPLTVDQAEGSSLQPTTGTDSQLQSNTSATSISGGETAPTAPSTPAVPPANTGPAPKDSTERLQPQPSQNGAEGLQGLNTTLNQIRSLAFNLLSS